MDLDKDEKEYLSELLYNSINMQYFHNTTPLDKLVMQVFNDNLKIILECKEKHLDCKIFQKIYKKK